MFDLIIIGAASTGLSAAIYAARKKLKTIILTKQIGGQSLLTNSIENYPGFELISGKDLIQKMQKQVEKYGVEIKSGVEVKEIKKQGNIFKVDNYESRAVLIATGKIPRRLNIPGEKRLENKGISFCSICDAPLYKGKDVAVIGGGNAGLDAALDLTKYANKIYVLEITDKLLGDELTQERLISSDKVEFIFNVKAKEIKGQDQVEGLVHNNGELKVQGVFVAIGQIPGTGFVKGLLELNQSGEIIIDPITNAANVPGIFAAGDVTNIIFKQCIICAGEGAKAALNVYEFLKKRR